MSWFTKFKVKFPDGKASFAQFRAWVEDVLTSVETKAEEKVELCYEETKKSIGTYDSPTLSYNLEDGVAEVFINLGYRPTMVMIWGKVGVQGVIDYTASDPLGGVAVDGTPFTINERGSYGILSGTKYFYQDVNVIEIVDNGFYIRGILKKNLAGEEYITELGDSSSIFSGLHYFIAHKNGDVGTVAQDGVFNVIK